MTGDYLWVVLGDASRLPVYTSSNKYMVVGWLLTRKNNRMLRLFRLRENQSGSRIEVCIPHLLENPNQPAPVKGHC